MNSIDISYNDDNTSDDDRDPFEAEQGTDEYIKEIEEDAMDQQYPERNNDEIYEHVLGPVNESEMKWWNSQYHSRTTKSIASVADDTVDISQDQEHASYITTEVTQEEVGDFLCNYEPIFYPPIKTKQPISKCSKSPTKITKCQKNKKRKRMFWVYERNSIAEKVVKYIEA